MFRPLLDGTAVDRRRDRLRTAGHGGSHADGGVPHRRRHAERDGARARGGEGRRVGRPQLRRRGRRTRSACPSAAAWSAPASSATSRTTTCAGCSTSSSASPPAASLTRAQASGSFSHHWHHQSAPTRIRSFGCQQYEMLGRVLEVVEAVVALLVAGRVAHEDGGLATGSRSWIDSFSSISFGSGSGIT